MAASAGQHLPVGPAATEWQSSTAPFAHPTIRLKHASVYAVMAGLLGCVSCSAASLVSSPRDSSISALAGHVLLTAVTAVASLLSAIQARHCWKRKHIPACSVQVADPALFFLALVLPMILVLVRFNPLPASDDTKGNCIITFAFLLRLGAMLDLPPRHTIVQFVFTFPFLTFLDFHRRCHQPAAYPDMCLYQGGVASAGAQVHCCSLPSFGHHLLSRGISMFVLGLVAISAPMVMAIKQARANAQPDLRLSEDYLPESLRTSVVESVRAGRTSDGTGSEPTAYWLPNAFHTLLDWMSPLTSQVEAWLSVAADQVDEVVLVVVVCVPFALYYASFALIGRIMPKWASTDKVTADEWLLVLSIFFVLGRESCIMDTMPLLQRIQGQLARAQVVLADILPSHVVDILLLERRPRTSGEGVAAGGEAAAAPGAEGAAGQEAARPNQASAAGTADNGLLSVPMLLAATGQLGANISDHRLQQLAGCKKFKLAETHECVTIFFSEICDFAEWARSLPASKVMQTLNDLYSRLDDIIINELPGLYKVETINDAYLVACNLITSDEQHAATMIRFALRAQEEASRVLRPDLTDGSSLQLRIGIHSGPTVSGFVGKVRRHFCLFGNTINMACRTETSCPPGCIQVTDATCQLALPYLEGKLYFKDRGEVPVKGAIKPLHMYLVVPQELRHLSRSLKAADVDLLHASEGGPSMLSGEEGRSPISATSGEKAPHEEVGSGSSESAALMHQLAVQGHVSLSEQAGYMRDFSGIHSGQAGLTH